MKKQTKPIEKIEIEQVERYSPNGSSHWVWEYPIESVVGKINEVIDRLNMLSQLKREEKK